jgi:DNA-damage-inducible protein D
VLLPLLGYTTWHTFITVIERAMVSGKNQELDVVRNFTEVRKVARRAGPPQTDFELSRIAAYLTAMCGDPHKPEVAAAL